MTDLTNVTQLRPEGAARPTISEAEAEALTLDSYLMQIHQNDCTNCTCSERWGDLYEVWVHPTKTRLSKLHVLRPATSLQRLEIAYLETSPKVVPICSECVANFSLDDLPSPIPALSARAWADTLQRKYTPAPIPTSSKKVEPTLDQL